MKISFVVHSLYNIGGTIRTTLNTAEALADRGHDIEIASVFRRRDQPLFDVDDRIDVVSLVDTRPDAEPLDPADEALAAKPSKLFPKTEPRYDQYDRLADARIAAYLRGCDADVIVGTRPGLNIALARYAPATAVKVGQEHLFLAKHGRRLTRRLYRAYRRLDAVTTVSDTDARDYRRRMPAIADRIGFIPNSVPGTRLAKTDCTTKTVVAAGRIEPIKRYDLLIEAFAKVVAVHPDWRLRIYGHGTQRPALRELIEERGLYGNVMLMGTYTPIDTEWVKGSIAAVTSELESFGLTIVEAMGCGLPVVSMACPYGPAEIIEDGKTGVLTPPGDVDAFAAALIDLIEDDRRRTTMGALAAAHAQRYSPETVSGEYEELFTRLLSDRGGAPRTATTARAARRPNRTAVDCRSVDLETVRLDRADLASPRLVGEEESVPVVDGTIRLADLSEGTWVLTSEGRNVPAGGVDSRVLLAPPPADVDGAVIPFSLDGDLAVRVWRRDRYAELDRVRWNDGTLTVTGSILGRAIPDGEVSAHVQYRKASARRLSVAASRSGARFTVDVDGAALAAVPDADGLWDLWLGLGEERVRVGRFFDDLAIRKKTGRIPARYHELAGETVRLKPYFTVNNQLSIRVGEPPNSENENE